MDQFRNENKQITLDEVLEMFNYEEITSFILRNYYILEDEKENLLNFIQSLPDYYKYIVFTCIFQQFEEDKFDFDLINNFGEQNFKSDLESVIYVFNYFHFYGTNGGKDARKQLIMLKERILTREILIPNENNYESESQIRGVQFNVSISQVENIEDFKSILVSTFDYFAELIYKNLELSFSFEDFTKLREIHPYYLLLLIRASNVISIDVHIIVDKIIELEIYGDGYRKSKFWSDTRVFGKKLTDLAPTKLGSFIKSRMILKQHPLKYDSKDNGDNKREENSSIKNENKEEVELIDIDFTNVLLETNSVEEFESIIRSYFEKYIDLIGTTLCKNLSSEDYIKLSSLHFYYLFLLLTAIPELKINATEVAKKITEFKIFPNVYTRKKYSQDKNFITFKLKFILPEKLEDFVARRDEIIFNINETRRRLNNLEDNSNELSEEDIEDITETPNNNFEYEIPPNLLGTIELLNLPESLKQSLFDYISNLLEFSDAQKFLERFSLFLKNIKLELVSTSDIEYKIGLINRFIFQLESINLNYYIPELQDTLMSVENSYHFYLNNNSNSYIEENDTELLKEDKEMLLNLINEYFDLEIKIDEFSDFNQIRNKLSMVIFTGNYSEKLKELIIFLKNKLKNRLNSRLYRIFIELGDLAYNLIPELLSKNIIEIEKTNLGLVDNLEDESSENTYDEEPEDSELISEDNIDEMLGDFDVNELTERY